MTKIPLFILFLVILNGGVIHSLAQGFDWYGDGTNGLNTLPYSWEVDQLPREPRVDFYRDLNNCISVLTRKCNRQLYFYIFRKRRMNEGCCQKFLQMGRPCKDSLAWTLIHSEKYEKYEGHISERSEAAFNKCSENGRDYGWY